MRAGLLPQAPGVRLGRQALAAAAPGERVQEGVGGGVVALAGYAEDAGAGREQHEPGEVEVAGQLVEVRRGVHLRPAARCRPLGVSAVTDAVVEDPGRCTTAVSGRSRRDRGDEPGDGVPVGDVGGGHATVARGAVSSATSSAAPVASGPPRLTRRSGAVRRAG